MTFCLCLSVAGRELSVADDLQLLTVYLWVFIFYWSLNLLISVSFFFFFFPPPNQQEAEAVDPTPAQAKVDVHPHRKRVKGQHAVNQSQESAEGGVVTDLPVKWAITATPSLAKVTQGQVSATVIHTGATLSHRTTTPRSPTATPPLLSQLQAPVPRASEAMPPPTAPQACLPLIVWPVWPPRPHSTVARLLEPHLGES